MLCLSLITCNPFRQLFHPFLTHRLLKPSFRFNCYTSLPFKPPQLFRNLHSPAMCIRSISKSHIYPFFFILLTFLRAIHLPCKYSQISGALVEFTRFTFKLQRPQPCPFLYLNLSHSIYRSKIHLSARLDIIVSDLLRLLI